MKHWKMIADVQRLTPADFRVINNTRTYRLQMRVGDTWQDVQVCPWYESNRVYGILVPWETRFLWRAKRQIRRMLEYSENAHKERQWTIAST